MRTVSLIAIPNIPLIKSGDDLAQIICQCAENNGLALQDRDLLVIAQKVVSKAEGRVVRLADVVPSRRAIDMARRAHKDPRLVELILQESNEVLWASDSLIIAEQKLGVICANAGIDRSNAGPVDEDLVCLLPQDPDASAQRIRAGIEKIAGVDVAVIINDTHGRAFRDGAVGVAIGIAGMRPVIDERGEQDLFGYKFQSTVIATADEIASAASLLMGQTNEALPVILVRGVEFQKGEGSAKELIRVKEKDIFRRGGYPEP